MKLNIKNVSERLKEKSALAKKSNVTFRISDEIIHKFKEVCKKQDFGSGMVIEELMLEYIESTNSGKNK